MLLTTLRLLRRRALLSGRLGGSGVDNSGRRSWSTLDLRCRFGLLLRWRGFLSRWLHGSGMDDPWRRRSWSMMDLRWWRFNFLLRRWGLLRGWLGGSGVDNPGRRSWGTLDLRYRFGFLLRRRGLLSRRLGRWRADNLGLRSRSTDNLWRWCLDFLFRRRVHLGSRLLDGWRLSTGCRHWSRFWGGAFWRNCFDLRDRFRRRHIGRCGRWRGDRFRRFLV